MGSKTTAMGLIIYRPRSLWWSPSVKTGVFNEAPSNAGSDSPCDWLMGLPLPAVTGGQSITPCARLQ